MRLITFFPTHRRWQDSVSAYVDDELPAAQRPRFEAHLASCQSCALAVEGEQAAKAMLARALPEAPLPRSFRLTEAMVAPRPAMLQRPGRHAQAAMVGRVMQFSAAAAVIALAVIVAVDVAGNGSDGRSQSDADVQGAPAAESTAGGATSAAAPATTSTEALSGGATIPPPASGNLQGQSLTTPTAAAKSTDRQGGPTAAPTEAAGYAAFDDSDLKRPTATTPIVEINRLRAFEFALGIIAAASAATWLVFRQTRKE